MISRNEIPIVAAAPVRWSRLPVAETPTSDRASAACYRGIEDRRVVAVVVLELRLGGSISRGMLHTGPSRRARPVVIDSEPPWSPLPRGWAACRAP
jgi:hypothetical protein